MKRTVFYILIWLIGCLPLLAQSIPTAPYLPALSSKTNDRAPITVQHPQEKAILPAGAEKIYVFGKLNLENPTLDINGQAVEPYKNGTFMAYIPVQQGTFEIVLTAQSQGQTYQAVRRVVVAGKPISTFSGKARFDENQIYPSRPLWLMPGDTVQLSARGTPGAQVTATLSGLKNAKDIPLKENKRYSGLYQAQYSIAENEKPRSVKIRYKLTDPQTKTETKITAKQKLKILDAKEPLQAARVTDSGSKMRQLAVHQGSLYPYYRAFGEILIDGRDNGLYRVHLANGETAWLEEKKVDFISGYHTNRLENVRTLAQPRATQITWNITKQVPISIREFNNRLELTFYYTDLFEENFDFDATSPLLENMTWDMVQDGVIKFTLYLKPEQTLWGYAYQYDKNAFILQLNHRPETKGSAQKPLDGVRILLDAGHSPKRVPPYDGLVSPSGFLEYEANLALAEVLKPKLEAAGATVIMTRQGNNHISLSGRYKKALQEQAHIFISLHHNALPETVNPLAVPRGYSVYYTYPHSFKLAESIYKKFNQKIPLADNGMIANDVLFIPRISEMPSILIENAYMILPEQEELVMSDKGRELFAQTIYEGILEFYGVNTTPKTPAKRTKSKKK